MNAITSFQADVLASTTLSPFGRGNDEPILKACAAFDALERQYLAGDFSDENECLADADRVRIVEEQEPLLDAILEHPCTTLRAAQALARSLALWDQELLSGGHKDTGGLLAAKLVRSLTEMAPDDADADLLTLQPEYDQLRAEYDDFNTNPQNFDPDADLGRAYDEFCERVVHMPPAKTAAGRVLKAKAALGLHTYVDDGGQASRAVCALLQELVEGGGA